MSNETTFPADILDPARLERELLRLADEVAGRLRKERIVAGTVGLKYRLHDFRTFSRQVALPAPTDVAAEIHAALVPLLRRLNAEHREPVRLLGLRASDVIDLQDAGRQSTLDAPERSPRDAEVALDEVRRKFGAAIIGQASLLEPRGTDAGGAGGGGAGGDAGGGGAGGTDAG